jgi:hypothetical protein
MSTGLRWLAGNLDSDSETSAPVLPLIRSESRRRRIRLKKVFLCPLLCDRSDLFPFQFLSLAVSFGFL